jgi:hypothetical protein
VRRADSLTTLMCRLSRNPGALTSRTPQGHVGLFRDYLTLNGRLNVDETVRLVRYLHLGLEERLLASYIMGYVYSMPVIVNVCNVLMYLELE